MARFGSGAALSMTAGDNNLVTNSLFVGNVAAVDGGAISSSARQLLIVNCVFSGNSAGSTGGAISLRSTDTQATISNSTFFGNSASLGDTISMLITNSSFPQALVVENSIFSSGGNQIWEDDANTGSIAITYSDIEGGWPGTGNINIDPMFVDPDGADNILGTEDDDLRLAEGSPCIDAGDNTAAGLFGLDTDISGRLRFIDDEITVDTGVGAAPVVDMGAHEFQCSTDALPAAPPLAAVAPFDITTDRYLSFNPSTNPGQSTALRVTRVGSSTPWYVSCALQDAGADGMLSMLVTSPELCEWTDSVIHVRGCEIVPGNEYLIDATRCDLFYSPTLSVITTAPQIDASRQYGDVVGAFVGGVWLAAEGLVTANDIVAVVQKFQLLATAPHISRVDNDGKTPNGVIASNDILRAVTAFAGNDFGYGVTNCLTGTCEPSCP